MSFVRPSFESKDWRSLRFNFEQIEVCRSRPCQCVGSRFIQGIELTRLVENRVQNNRKSIAMVLDTNSLQEIRCVVRDWVQALAEGRFEDAANAMTSSDSLCSASSLREAVGGYCRRYREASAIDKKKYSPKVTCPFELDDRGENLVAYWKHGAVHIEYELPVEREWSDLTAKFRLKKVHDGRFSLSLTDLRVL